MKKILLKTIILFAIFALSTSFVMADTKEDFCKSLPVSESGDVLLGTSPEFTPLSGLLSMGTKTYAYGCSPAYRIVLEVLKHTVHFKEVQIVFSDGSSLTPINLKGDLSDGETRTAYVGGKDGLVIEEVHIKAGNWMDGSSQYRVYLQLSE